MLTYRSQNIKTNLFYLGFYARKAVAWKLKPLLWMCMLLLLSRRMGRVDRWTDRTMTTAASQRLSGWNSGFETWQWRQRTGRRWGRCWGHGGRALARWDKVRRTGWVWLVHHDTTHYDDTTVEQTIIFCCHFFVFSAALFQQFLLFTDFKLNNCGWCLQFDWKLLRVFL